MDLRQTLLPDHLYPTCLCVGRKHAGIEQGVEDIRKIEVGLYGLIDLVERSNLGAFQFKDRRSRQVEKQDQDRDSAIGDCEDGGEIQEFFDEEAVQNQLGIGIQL